ncbi:MAG TPA: tyrosine-type recombinase/integrase [Rhodothermales bacterium]|nr:tyrosine-type recombinase/integrase [Rhodothermales bacterium]
MSMPLQSALADPITRFVAYKRALGRRYHTEASALHLLDRFLAEEQVRCPGEVTPAMIEAFMASRPRSRARSYNHLLGTVRRLFEWLVGQEELVQTPVLVRGRRTSAHRLPFIIDPQAASRLLTLARQMPDNPKAPMRGATYHALFALLYGLGLRLGEACRLQLGDVDLERELVLIRDTKFFKSRLVPFGPRMAAMLRGYVQARTARSTGPNSPLFSFTSRGYVHHCTVSQTFHGLVPQLGLTIPPGLSPLRLHDLRHAFAVGTVLRWYRNGADPGAGLLKLATFMGHVDISSTGSGLCLTEMPPGIPACLDRIRKLVTRREAVPGSTPKHRTPAA